MSADNLLNFWSRNTSDVWKYFGFEKDNEGGYKDKKSAICRVCKSAVKYSGNTTNLNGHLNRYHYTVRYPQNSAAGKNTGTCFQPTLSNVLDRKQCLPIESQRAVSITNGIVNFIVGDLKPISIMEGAGFKSMLHQIEPKYKIPSRGHIVDKYILPKYENTKLALQLKLASSPRHAVTGDFWTSSASGDPYLTITVHFIDDDFKLNSNVLLTRTVHESHTGENIAHEFSKDVEEWGLRDPFAVSDHAANMMSAFSTHLGWPHMGCLGHCLNLVVTKGLKLQNISKLTAKVRKLFSHFRRSHISAQQLREKQKQLGIPQHKLLIDVETRWNSTLIMLSRFVEQEPAVSAVFTCPRKKKTTASIIVPMLKKIAAILQPCEDDSNIIANMKNEMLKDFNIRYQSDEVQLFINTCTLLDPRFHDIFIDGETMESITRDLCQKTCPIKVKVEPVDNTSTDSQSGAEATPPLPQLDTVNHSPDRESEPEPKRAKMDTTSTLQDFLGDILFIRHERKSLTQQQIIRQEIERYISECTRSPPDTNSDPLQWWKDRAIIYPNLSVFVKQYLCVPATSVPSERIFSCAGNTLTNKRASLSEDNVDKLIFLNKNIALSDRI
ncbi:E3 SUMO-protein ligase ZBED1-like [Argopecten irradians]|uniref:E3 SUMO-protein ligase ZBED1-like n=1 Tax=Argopecten irradians TaxID=31199 RepID=UPI0037163738